MYFRHDKPREEQKKFLQDVYGALNKKMHIVAHAPTGMGKTDASLGAALTIAKEQGYTIFFLTPKISQHKIALDVVKGINKKYNEDFRAVDIVGRRYSCIHPLLEEMEQEGFYKMCSLLRKEEKCPFYKNAKGYSEQEEQKANILFAKKEGELINKYYNEVIDVAKRCESCPYEWLTKLAKRADVIIADYFHLLSPKIRDVFLLRIKKDIEDSIVIIDEAHNLPARMRSNLSSTINNYIIRRHEKEAYELGYEPLITENEFVNWIEDELKGKKEKEVKEFPFRDDNEIIDELYYIAEQMIEKGEKRTASSKIAYFLEYFEGDQALIIKKSGTRCSLSRKFLDPSKATGFLNKSIGTILMSGTLLPTSMYRDLTGLDKERTILKIYKSPFNKNNKLNLIVKGITTKYSKRKEQYELIANQLDNICLTAPKGIAIFFPSYEVMHEVMKFMRYRKIFVQEPRMKASEALELAKRFKQKGGALLAVQGGSLSEGIDFNEGEIKVAVIVGVGLEEMSLEVKLLIDYYQEKFGKGWEYAYIYPAMTRSMQAAGRAIRKEEDRAVIVYLDERFGWKNYFKLFPKGEQFITTKEPEKWIKRFFNLD